MKRIVLVTTIACAGLVGCSQTSDSGTSGTNQSSSGNPLTAPVDYLGAVSKAHHSAKTKTAVFSIDSAVKMFQSEEGRNPKSLDEIVGGDYLPKLPDLPPNLKFEYNPTTGKVSVVPK